MPPPLGTFAGGLARLEADRVVDVVSTDNGLSSDLVRSPDKRRPVLILSRPDVIDLLDTVMVAPITSTVRGSPGEVIVGVDEGLKARSAANLDHVQTVRKESLRTFVGSVDEATMADVCRALSIATGCAD